MKKILQHKRIFNLIFSVLVLFSSVTGCKSTDDSKYNENQYISVLAHADKNYSEEKYIEAQKQYTEALKYKTNNEISEKVKLCEELSKSLDNYNLGKDYLSKKQYLNAYNFFNLVSPQDTKRYNDANQKANETKKLYVETEIASANEYVNKNNYSLAVQIIDRALSIDKDSQSLQEIKNKYQSALNEQIEAQNKADQERLKKEAEAEEKAKAKTLAKKEAEQKAIAERKESEKKSITVYVTRTGEKYHRNGCRYLRRSKIAISLENAKFAYSPCSVCNPPR